MMLIMLLSLINNVTAIRKRKPAQGKCKITPFNLLCIPDKEFPVQSQSWKQ